MTGKDSGSGNVNVFDQIQSICNEFRRQLTRGESSRIDDYLERLDESAQANLFQNLLHIDIEFRRRSGEQPTSPDYVQRFPQFRRLIRQAFFEETLMSVDLGATPRVPPADGATASLNQGGSHDSQDLLERLPASRLGEYELIRELGRGAFGVVYEARHLQQENHVALKTLPTGIEGQASSFNDAERLHKFRREFRSLAEFNHPHLVGMQTLEVDGSQWFFTMDLVDGTDFLDFVRPDDELDEKRLRKTLPQLASGIMALHGQHIVHRDLKPTNVLVGEDGRVVILDFGLVVEFDRRTDVTMSLQSQHFAGTPRYAAPEQIFGQRTAASDWYAMGVMLYEALTGEPPYGSSSAGKLFLKKQNEDAPKLAGRSDFPNDLAELADQLLARDPEQRPDALAIAASLSVDLESRSSHDSVEDSLSLSSSSSSASGLILIGRESQLAELEQCRGRLLKERNPMTLFIGGRSGEGKTSLAEKFLAPHRLGTEMLVLSGRCYDRESVPFKAVDCIIDALVFFLRSRKTDEVSRLLSEEIPFLAHLFPVMRRVESIAQLPSGRIGELDSKQVRNRAFAALRDLLYRISQDTPIIMFIDDLQWGDADSAEALSELLLGEQPPVLLFIGSYRSDEAEESPFLVQWNKSIDDVNSNLKGSDISVGPLSREQCLELVVTRIGIDSESIRDKAEELYQNTGGNPYFLEQLIECFDPDTGSFTPAPLNEVIDSRLKKLPAEAAKLLDVIAVSGQAISIGEASHAAGQSKPDVGTITHMRNERLVRLIGSEEQQLVDTYHDKIRETVLDELPENELRELHSAIGQTIETQQNINAEELLKSVDSSLSVACRGKQKIHPRVVDLAYHFYHARDSRGFAYQMLAGETAFGAYAAEDAIEHFKKAEECLSNSAADSQRYRLWGQMGLVHYELSQAERAITYFEQAIQVAPTNLDRARVQAGSATIHVCTGRLFEAMDGFDVALAALGKRRPKNFLTRLFSILGLMVRIYVIPSDWQRAKNVEAVSRAGLEYEIYMRLASFSFDVSIPQLVHCVMRQCALTIRTGNKDLMALGYALTSSMLAAASFMQRLATIGLRWSSKLGEQTKDRKVRAMLNYWRGDYHRNLSDFPTAVIEYEKCIESVEQGLDAQVGLPLTMLRRVLAQYGTSTAELNAARKELDWAIQLEDYRGMCWGHYGAANAMARAGNISDARIHMVESYAAIMEQRIAHLSKASCIGTDGFVLVQASEYSNATDKLEDAWKLTLKHWLLFPDCIRNLPLLLEGLAGPNWHMIENKKEARRLRKLCRQAAWMAWFCTSMRAHIQRARGRALFALGRRKRGIRLFEKAVFNARELQSDYELARCLLDLAAVKEKDREQNRKEAVEMLKKSESVIPHAEAWLLGDNPDKDCVAPAT